MNNESVADELKGEVKGSASINNPVIHVRHVDLKRVDDSQYRRQCPVCLKGILPVTRNPTTFQLETEDRCLFCGQRYSYDDIEEMKRRDYITE